MTNLEKAEEIIDKYFSSAECGIFNCRNFFGDDMAMVYSSDGLTIYVCYSYSYFEVFGLSDSEFKELEDHYDFLTEKTRIERQRK